MSNNQSEQPQPAAPVFEAKPLRSIQEIIADLKKPVAAKHLSQRKQGNQMLSYFAWYHAVRYLDHYAPGWSYSVLSVQTIGENCVLSVRLSIPCLEGVVSREATGIEPLIVKGYGDTSSNAESMALRRAAAKFGLGLYLYEK
jgi:hypothetical protein